MPRERSRLLPVLLTAIVGLGALSIDMFLPSLPAMMTAFGSDAATAQLTVTLFLAGLAASQLAWGPLSDRLGRRRVLLAGLAVYAAAGTACAFAPTMMLLVVLRVVQALGAGSGPVIARAIVRDLYEPERVARVLAAMGTAQALTPILAPIVGGWVHVLAGWRAVFLVLGAFGAVFVLTAWAIVPETNIYAGARVRDAGGGVAALLRHPRYLAYVASAALTFSGQFAFITGSSFALITILGVSPTVYGVCFGAVAGGLMAGNFVSVRLGPRARHRHDDPRRHAHRRGRRHRHGRARVGGRALRGDRDRSDVVLRLRPRLGAAERHGRRHRAISADGGTGGSRCRLRTADGLGTVCDRRQSHL